MVDALGGAHARPSSVCVTNWFVGKCGCGVSCCWDVVPTCMCNACMHECVHARCDFFVFMFLILCHSYFYMYTKSDDNGTSSSRNETTRKVTRDKYKREVGREAWGYDTKLPADRGLQMEFSRLVYRTVLGVCVSSVAGQ